MGQYSSKQMCICFGLASPKQISLLKISKGVKNLGITSVVFWEKMTLGITSVIFGRNINLGITLGEN